MSAPSGNGTLELDSAPPMTRRMPTRVSNACRRCRRNKSRCDSYRPCSLCSRANVPCESAPVDEPPRSKSRSCNRRVGANRRKGAQSRGSSDGSYSTTAPPTRQPSLPSEHNVVDSVGGQPVGTKTPVPADRRGSWVPVDYGESESAMGIARKIYSLGSQSIDDHLTSAIPDGECGNRNPQRRTGDKRLPISAMLGSRFPDQQAIQSLLEDYFESVHWFSLVIYEPKFRQRLLSIKDGYAYPAEAPFLTLLSMILCMAAWYRSKRAAHNGEEWRLWSDDLLKIVESRLVQVMDQHSIAAVQTCILLGSHHVYHGRPNLSFALLGAAVKMSHAMGLHRDFTGGTFGDIEERKRVWWTIYTWDRFASISYGRPLSINDEDCSVGMPAEFTESPYFTQQSVEQGLPDITYSLYQTGLSKLYLVASPALKNIFGSLSVRSAKQHFESTYASLVSEVTQRLLVWRRQLPQHLSLDLNKDYHPDNTEWGSRAYILQSLSLQLTFDNLLIVLHRPFLTRQVENLSMTASALYTNLPQTGSPSVQPQMSSLTPHADNLFSRDHASPGWEKNASSEHWWNAAVRTARVTELPQLAQLATDSHLVAFMALNLFHAAIVLILVALSDPLSDSAQGVKRTITRVFRLQELLGQRSALSRQSSVVLKNLIGLLLRREAEAMLGPVTSAPVVGSHAEHQLKAADDSGLLSVEDTLRLPLEATLSTQDQGTENQAWPNLSRAQRLNESLASVQRIFPTIQDALPRSDTTMVSRHDVNIQDGLLPLTQQELPLVPFVQSDGYEEPQAIEDQAQAVDYGGNSLFWLWDSNWSGDFVQ